MHHYCRLVTFSLGLQRVVQAGKLKEDATFFAGVGTARRTSVQSTDKPLQCLSAASAIINCVVDRILPSELIRYCPEYYFALSAFGTAVLIRVRIASISANIDHCDLTCPFLSVYDPNSLAKLMRVKKLESLTWSNAY